MGEWSRSPTQESMSWRSWVGMVLAWVVMFTAGGVLLAGVVVPRVAGGTPYAVLTDSMEPRYPAGTLVVTRPVAPAELRAGDVITYQLASGESTVATHRITATSVNLAGEYVFRTKGDANAAVDPAPVQQVQVRGKLWYSVPLLGHLSNVLTGPQRHVGTIVAAVLLLGYAGYMFLGAARDRHRRRHEHQEVSG